MQSDGEAAQGLDSIGNGEDRRVSDSSSFGGEAKASGGDQISLSLRQGEQPGASSSRSSSVLGHGFSEPGVDSSESCSRTLFQSSTELRLHTQQTQQTQQPTKPYIPYIPSSILVQSQQSVSTSSIFDSLGHEQQHVVGSICVPDADADIIVRSKDSHTPVDLSNLHHAPEIQNMSYTTTKTTQPYIFKL
jgi:hypothetical protein